MSRSKKDGKHGGGHKMHWLHENCRADRYCVMDTCSADCAGCKWYSTCRKYGARNKKKEKMYAKSTSSKSLVQCIRDEES